MTNITMFSLATVVSKHYGITVDELKSHSRKQKHYKPRAVFCALARTHTKQTYPNIARYLSGRDHTSVIHSAKRAPRYATEETLKKLIELAIEHDKTRKESIYVEDPTKLYRS